MQHLGDLERPGKFIQPLVKWVFPLGLTSVLPGEPPYELEFDKVNPTHMNVKLRRSSP